MASATFGESLLERLPDRSLGPRLARQWSVSPDGLTYTFDLRTDVKWHDGSDFTSDDVKFTMESVIKDGSINNRFAQWRGLIDRIDTPSPSQVVLKLKKADYSAIYALADPGAGQQPMFPRKYVTAAGDDVAAAKPIGTGPWRFVEFRPGELVRLSAVEGHWRQTPRFEELVIRQVPEAATRVAMVLRGEADLAQVPLSFSKQIQDAGLNLFQQPNAYPLFIHLGGQYLPSRPSFKAGVPWAADPKDTTAWERARKVREALDIAIDRQAIVRAILAGQGSPATDLLALPGSRFADASRSVPASDVSRAKQLLAEAGYPNGFDMPLLLVEASGRPLAPEVGQAVAQYWQAIGIRVTQERADYASSVRPKFISRSLAGVAVAYALIAYDEPFAGLIAAFTSDADTQLGAEYPPLDDLIKRSAATSDPEARAKVQVEALKMMTDQHFVITTAWAHSLIASGKRVAKLPQVSGVTNWHNLEYATSE